MNEHLDGLRSGEYIDAHLTAWETGQTGVPPADACMRAVRDTGWLNFNGPWSSPMRVITCGPMEGVADSLARLFVDFEPGIHYCQVQMQSGVTGINAVRMYNPYKQRPGPKRNIVRQWVPELRISLSPHFWTHRECNRIYSPGRPPIPPR